VEIKNIMAAKDPNSSTVTQDGHGKTSEYNLFWKNVGRANVPDDVKAHYEVSLVFSALVLYG
jgi:hypothetical protein